MPMHLRTITKNVKKGKKHSRISERDKSMIHHFMKDAIDRNQFAPLSVIRLMLKDKSVCIYYNILNKK